MNQRMGFVSLIGAAIALALLGIIIKFLEQYFGNFAQVAVPQASLALLLLVILRIQGISIRPKVGVSWVQLLLFVIYSVGSTVFFIFAVTGEGNATHSVFYLYVATYITSFVVGIVFHREKPDRKSIAGTVVALAGLFIYAYPIGIKLTSQEFIFGTLSGISFALSFSAQKYLLEQNRRVLTFYRAIGGLVISSIIIALSGEELRAEIDLVLLPRMVVIAVVFLAISEFILYGFANFPLGMGSIVISTEILFAMIINKIVLSEHPTITEVVGGLLILVAAVISNLSAEDWQMIRQLSWQRITVRPS